jgi:hypothetical protein
MVIGNGKRVGKVEKASTFKLCANFLMLVGVTSPKKKRIKKKEFACFSYFFFL